MFQGASEGCAVRIKSRFNRSCQCATVDFSEFQSSARIRVLVGTTSQHKHGDGTRQIFFEILLGKARIVSAELVEAQGSVMASVAKDGTFESAVGVLDF